MARNTLPPPTCRAAPTRHVSPMPFVHHGSQHATTANPPHRFNTAHKTFGPMLNPFVPAPTPRHRQPTAPPQHGTQDLDHPPTSTPPQNGNLTWRATAPRPPATSRNTPPTRHAPSTRHAWLSQQPPPTPTPPRHDPTTADPPCRLNAVRNTPPPTDSPPRQDPATADPPCRPNTARKTPLPQHGPRAGVNVDTDMQVVAFLQDVWGQLLQHATSEWIAHSPRVVAGREEQLHQLATPSAPGRLFAAHRVCEACQRGDYDAAAFEEHQLRVLTTGQGGLSAALPSLSVVPPPLSLVPTPSPSAVLSAVVLGASAMSPLFFSGAAPSSVPGSSATTVVPVIEATATSVLSSSQHPIHQATLTASVVLAVPESPPRCGANGLSTAEPPVLFQLDYRVPSGTDCAAVTVFWRNKFMWAGVSLEVAQAHFTFVQERYAEVLGEAVVPVSPSLEPPSKHVKVENGEEPVRAVTEEGAEAVKVDSVEVVEVEGPAALGNLESEMVDA
ncbi:hypothetical protein EDB84DRAFT_1566634 [Lactarius hengduanensis]|nr:hypothetical protein EDB84DRAFT_1566634 [Lactarius hengduanensis]